MVHDCFKIFQAFAEIQPEPPKSIKIQNKVQRKKESLIKLTDENESIIIPLEQNQQIIPEIHRQVRVKKSHCSCLPLVQRKHNQIKSAKYLQYLKSVETCSVHSNDVSKIEKGIQSSQKPIKKVRIAEPQEQPSSEIHQIQKLKSPEKGILIHAKNKSSQQKNGNYSLNFQQEQYDIEDEIFSTEQNMEMIPEKSQINVFGPPSVEITPSQPQTNLFGPKINRLLDFNTEGQTNQLTQNLVQGNIPQEQLNNPNINLIEPPIKKEEQKKEIETIVNQPTINFGLQNNAEQKNILAVQGQTVQEDQQNQKNQEQQQQPQVIKNEQKFEIKPQGSGIFAQMGQLGGANSMGVFGQLNLQSQKSSSEGALGLIFNNQDSQKQDLSQKPLGNTGFFGSLGQLGQLGSQKQNINDGILGNINQGMNSTQETQNPIQQVPQQISQNSKSTSNPFGNLGNIGLGNQVSGNQGGQANSVFGTLGILGNQGTIGNQGFLGNQGTVGNQGTLGAQGSLGIQGTLGILGTQGKLGTLGLSNLGIQQPQQIQQPQLGTLGILGQNQNGNPPNQINMSQLVQSFGQNQPKQEIQDIFNYQAKQNQLDFQNPGNYFNSFDPQPAPQVNQYQLGESRYRNQKTPPKRESTRIE